jgi:Xaa-Pro aminopeptidase
MNFDYAGRVERLQGSMEDTGVDVALLSVGADLPYFTGYEARPSERLTVLVVPTRGVPILLVPLLEAPGVETGPFEVRSWTEVDDPVALATSIVSDPGSVAVGDHMWAVFLTRFQLHWGEASWLPASELTRELRIRKDPGEVELLRRAAHGIDRIMDRMSADVRFAGRTESELARHLADLTLAEGHESAEFTIVASGPNGASPHHHPGDRVIDEGDIVVCDFGGRLGGYYSDSTRTFVVGEPTDVQREVHELVVAANEAGRRAVAPGVTCEVVDAAARSVIDEVGFGEYFVHRTGHGIGLEVHEHPYLVSGNDLPLEPGMTFSVEPGIYLHGQFGVRIEDIVVCTSDGVESLNDSDRALVSVS